MGASHKGDVLLDCGAKGTRWLTRSGDIVAWAMFPDDAKLAVLRDSEIARRNSGLLQITDLQTKRTLHSRNLDTSSDVQLQSTCGTVVLITYHDGRASEAVDLQNDQQLPLDTFVDVRCSENRQVILRGIGTRGKATLLMQGKRSRVLAKNVAEFDISPDGRYVAYVADERLCGLDLANPGVDAECVRSILTTGRLVVNNRGEVLITESTNEPCPRDEDLQREPIKQRKARGHSWPCEAIFFWRIGTDFGKDQLVRFLAVAPSFVSRSEETKLTGPHR